MLSIASANATSVVVECAPRDIRVVAHAGSHAANAFLQSVKSAWTVVTSWMTLHGEKRRESYQSLTPRSYIDNDRSEYTCTEVVEHTLPHCGHRASLECYLDPLQYSCQEICGAVMGCCQKPCQGRCGDCRQLAVAADTPDAHLKREFVISRVCQSKPLLLINNGQSCLNPWFTC